MAPRQFRKGGAQSELVYATGACSLGMLLVAASAKGIAAVLLGDNRDALQRELAQRVPQARLVPGDKDFARVIAMVVDFVERRAVALELPLDIRGTAFQHRVWSALRDIPTGTTATYAEIARRIGRPKAVRAVAGACAANPLAVVVPCHRVIHSDGSLSGYRWGIARKRALLDKEARSAPGAAKSGARTLKASKSKPR